jgi:hypothetical protein
MLRGGKSIDLPQALLKTTKYIHEKNIVDFIIGGNLFFRLQPSKMGSS